MNRIQKAATLVIALTITLAGSAFVTAPLALASVQSVSPVTHSSLRGANGGAPYVRAST